MPLHYVIININWVDPHRGIPARGIPINKMMENNLTVSVHPQLIKEPKEILQEYEIFGGLSQY